MIVFLFLFYYGLWLADLTFLLSCSSWGLASCTLTKTGPKSQKIPPSNKARYITQSHATCQTFSRSHARSEFPHVTCHEFFIFMARSYKAKPKGYSAMMSS